MFTLLMAALVLLSSTGFGLVEHQCMMRGKSVQLVVSGEAKGCGACKKTTPLPAKETSHAVFKKKACCDEHQKHEKVEVVSSTTSGSSKFLKALPFSAVIPGFGFQAHLASGIATATSCFSSLRTFSSLYHGRTMLIFIDCFLI